MGRVGRRRVEHRCAGRGRNRRKGEIYMKGQRNGIIGFKMRKRSENERNRRAEEIIGSNITKGRVRGRKR